MRVLIALLVWAAAIAAGIGVSTVVADSIHHSSGGGSSDPSSITATDANSLFQSANFAKALSTATSQLGADAQVDSFTLYPGYLSVDAVKGNTDVNFYVDANGDHSQTTSNDLPVGDKLFPLSDVPSDFPSNFAQRISTKAKFPESQLHYLIIETDPISKKLQYFAYPVQNATVQNGTVTAAPIEYFQMNAPHGRLYEELSSQGLQPVKG
jgi:hypothetical protein